MDEFHVWITSRCNNIHFDERRKMTQLDEICPSSWTWNNWINLHDVSRCINFIHGIDCNIHEISSMDFNGWNLIYKNLWWNKVHKKIRSKILYNPWSIIHSKFYFNLYYSLKFHGWISMKYDLWISNGWLAELSIENYISSMRFHWQKFQ